MAADSYSFLDIVALPGVRGRFARGDAMVLLSASLDEALWANGPGAAVFGFSEIDDLLDAPAPLGATARRQIAATRGFPEIGADRSVAVRLQSGMESRVVPFQASALPLPDGAAGILLSVAAAADLAGRAEAALAGIAQPGQAAAIVDAEGQVVAASPEFAGFGVPQDLLRRLVAKAAEGTDQPLKQRIRVGERVLPAGVAPLADGASLVIVTEDDFFELPDDVMSADEAEATEVDPGEAVSFFPAGASASPDSVGEQDLPGVEVVLNDEAAEGWYFSKDEPASEEAQTPEARLAALKTAEPVRFSWRTDPQGRLLSVSPEFTAFAGLRFGELTGSDFGEIAARFGLENGTEIAALLQGRDTWSGRTVHWPMADGAIRVPVDLAALPTYSRTRGFEGFRGFGVVRSGDAVPASPDGAEAADPEAARAEASEGGLDQPEGETAARRDDDAPAAHLPSTAPAQASEVELSADERDAFLQIGERLKGDESRFGAGTVPAGGSMEAAGGGLGAYPVHGSDLVEPPAEGSEPPFEAVADVSSGDNASEPAEAGAGDTAGPAFPLLETPADDEGAASASAAEASPEEPQRQEGLTAPAMVPEDANALTDETRPAESEVTQDAPAWPEVQAADPGDATAPQEFSASEPSEAKGALEQVGERDALSSAFREEVPGNGEDGGAQEEIDHKGETSAPAAAENGGKGETSPLMDFDAREAATPEQAAPTAAFAAPAQASSFAVVQPADDQPVSAAPGDVTEPDPVEAGDPAEPRTGERQERDAGGHGLNDDVSAAAAAEASPFVEDEEAGAAGEHPEQAGAEHLTAAAGEAADAAEPARAEEGPAGEDDRAVTEPEGPKPDLPVESPRVPDGEPPRALSSDADALAAQSANREEPEWAGNEAAASEQLVQPVPLLSVAQESPGESEAAGAPEAAPESEQPAQAAPQEHSSDEAEPKAETASSDAAMESASEMAEADAAVGPIEQSAAEATVRPLAEDEVAAALPDTSDPVGGEIRAAGDPDANATGEASQARTASVAASVGPDEPARVQPDTSILDRLPVPVLIHSGDLLHYANPDFLGLTDYPSLAAFAEAGGLGCLFTAPWERITEGGDRQLRLRSSGGEEFPVEALLRTVPWGEAKALLLVLRRLDGAPPRETGDAVELQQRLTELGAIIDTATDGVALLAPDGTIRSISRPAEALFGLNSRDVSGRPFGFLFAAQSQRTVAEYLDGVAGDGVASVLNDGREVIGREAQGGFIPLFITIGTLPERSGFCAVMRDITQWKRAEEELTQSRALAERASNHKTEFLARVSHEIRTPLNAIIGFSELMLGEKFGTVGSDRYRDYLRDINRSGNHVLDLVNDLLDISKIEAGQQEMSYEAVALNDALSEAVATMQPQANRERVIIRSSFASRLPDVVADPRSVRQIALNILSNAIRFTQAGGQVIVSTAYDASGDVVMRVRDTGIGMSQAEIEQALKPFKQINSLKRTRGDGTGLGLPLTKAMVEANRARFAIGSDPGEGTMVEVTFPATRVLAG